MCWVSAIMQDKIDDWQRRYPQPWPRQPYVAPQPLVPLPTQEEIAEFRRLLEKAREQDRAESLDEKECASDEKRQALRDIAKSLGIEIEFV